MTSPAQHHLFQVNKDDKPLDKNKKENFHSVTSKLLYLVKQARPDLDTLVSFMTTRVTKSDVDNWKKLKRGLTFLKNTIKDKIMIIAKKWTDLYTWIDAAYDVHNNMRVHMGGTISMCYRIMHRISSKQRINVKSSTESELVGIGEYVPYNIWFIMFMGAQGYALKIYIVYQYNQIEICMEKNRRSLCTGNSRHIHIRSFFVKDRIDKKEMRVEYCLTHLMLADFFTKPLMGELFRKLRSIIMGYTSIFELYPTLLQSIKERVGI